VLPGFDSKAAQRPRTENGTYGTWYIPSPRRGLANLPGLRVTFQRGPESREGFLEI
jgi:hypothetical protein